MPRWRALPEELDPEIREFASQMRRLVDRSGLSIAAVADRTGYSKTSWERYLNGRLLPPQGAISALAEATGTDVRHLATMWELAERAWSRAEMRHDMTMEAIRISQARQALEAYGADSPAGKKGKSKPKSKARSKDRDEQAKAAATAPPPAPAPVAPKPQEHDRTTVLRRQSPAQQSPEPQDAVPGVAGAGGDRQQRQYSAPQPPGPPSPPGPFGPSGPSAHPDPNGGRPSGARRVGMFLAGVVGALAVIAAALFFFDPRGDESKASEPTPTPTKVDKKLPAGVKCSGADCAGEDPEVMGCGGQYAETSEDAMVGNAYIEVRYSEVCAAAWARVTDAAPGDTLRITAAKKSQKSEVGASTEAYTEMVAAKSAKAAKVCLEPVGGAEMCTGS